MEKLSPRQSELLDFVTARIDQSGVAPSYREIGAALGIGSTNGVSDHIKALIKKGYLERVGSRGNPRSLRLTQRANASAEEGVVGVPVLGRIAAGLPLLAHENYDGAIRVDSHLLPTGGGIFALVVHGESMIEDGIFDGDYLFVRETKSIQEGEIAVVMVDGEATVKRLYREEGRIRLQPANRDMDPIWVGEDEVFSVIGKAVGVYRRIR